MDDKRLGPTHHRHGGVTWRACLLSILLIPFNCYWVIQVEIVWYSGHPTCISLFQNAVFSLLVVSVFSLLLKRFRSLHLSEGELLFIYVAVVMATSVASHDFMQILFPSIPNLFWYATPENEWQELYWPHVPRWLTINAKEPLVGYYEGGSTFYTVQHLRAWLGPICWWSLFILAMFWVMLCLNVLVRKQWIEKEKLAYPIIQLPLALIQAERTSIFRARTLWMGIGIAVFIDALNGLAYLVPSLPMIPVKLHDITGYFTDKPWNAMGRTRVSFYPFAIGLAFFMPLDLAFSSWFFYLFRKMQLVLGSVIGPSALGSLLGTSAAIKFPYLTEQSVGAFLMLFAVAIYLGKRHLREIVARKSSDAEEPMSYPFALAGVAAGMLFLIAFCRVAGMDVWVVLLLFALYFAISLVITRMRAELGPPTHELTNMSSAQILVDVFGGRRLKVNNLVVMSYFYFFNRTYRSHAMPQQLEGFKAAQRIGVHPRMLIVAVLLGTIVGTIASFWTELHIGYSEPGAPGSWFARTSIRRLTSYLNLSREPDGGAMTFMGLGAAFTLFLTVMRLKFLWWPFHPVGYALSMNFGIDYIWFPVLIGSLLKWAILRYGGLRSLRSATPFFLGVILGEYAVGSLWSALSVILQTRTYAFWIF